jgi:DNA-directed RNA polymerase specialized sigma24 family protein
LYGIARNKLRESLRRGRVENDARRRLGMEPVVLDDRDLERVEERALAGAGPLARALAALPDPTRRALLARIVATTRSRPTWSARSRSSGSACIAV